MSKNHTKSDLKEMVEDLINNLRKYEDGTIITTWQLMKAAEADHIILDMSSHEEKLEGLPYNLDFVVHNENTNMS